MTLLLLQTNPAAQATPGKGGAGSVGSANAGGFAITRTVLAVTSGADTFVGTPLGGNFQIMGFQTASDKIDVRSLGITSALYATQVHVFSEAQGALVSFGATTLLLIGVSASSITSSNFVFDTSTTSTVIMQ